MSLDIIERTIGGELDKKFFLANHEAARLLSIGDDWTRLRIGTRLAIVDTGASIAGSPRYFFGLLSSPTAGLTNGPLGGVTSHFVGARQNNSSLVRNAGPPPSYSGTVTAAKKINAITTTVGNTLALFPADPASRRFPLIVEFLKGSPNWTVTYLVQANAAGGTSSDIDFDLMVQAMEADTMVDSEAVLDTVSGTYLQTPQSIAVDEVADGVLNAVCLAWDRSTVQLEWSECLFAKFA